MFLVYDTAETITTEENLPWSDSISIKPVNPDAKEVWSNNGFANIEGELFYYDTVEKIYNKQMPLAKIANKARVKQGVEEYKKHCQKLTKSGATMSRQAHMELVVKNNYHANLGETIFYVNNGAKKTDGDVQKITKPTKRQNEEFMKEYGVPMPAGYIQINSYMITEKDLVNNPEMTGEYNVTRYISVFNKRIEPLLVVFNPEIREDILIEDPKDRVYFTKQQCELVSGYPLKEGGQDSIDEVMTLSDSEVIFWNKVNRDPFFMYVDDSIEKVDQYWVDYNRKVVKFQANSVKDIVDQEDEFIQRNGHDYAYHAAIPVD